MFIIIGIVVIGAVLFFTLGKRIPGISTTERERIDIEDCIKNSIDNALRLVLANGGVANPTNYWEYQGKKLAFLCYTNNFNEKCTNQVPFLGDEIKRGVEEFARDNIKDCFYALEQEYKDRGYQVSSGDLDFSVEIVPDKMLITVKKKISFTRDNERNVYEDFSLIRPSGLFYILMAVHDIIDQEARYCTFDALQYSMIKPEFKVTLKTIGTETKIYSVNYKKTGEEIFFAVRSCAFAPNIV